MHEVQSSGIDPYSSNYITTSKVDWAGGGQTPKTKTQSQKLPFES